tara:strand:+ start:635 stop:997 length:363 start_codon:yes stop_codon:yes gene_type:complete
MNDGVKTPCGHRYHSECFFKWIYKKKTCPLCREVLISPTEDEEFLHEIRRQIEWESSIYSTLRNNTTSLERNIVVKTQFLKKLEDEVMLKKQQLKKITNQYKDFIQKSAVKRRRRQGLLL